MDQRDTRNTEAAVGLNAGLMLANPKEGGPGKFAVLPEGATTVDLRAYHKLGHRPFETERVVRLHDPKSFVAYVAMWDGIDEQQILVFADKEASSFTAIIDYDAPGFPAHGVHRASYICPQSDEWRAWSDVKGKWLTQVELATFLEERIGDVTYPAQADLLELAQELSLDRQRTFTGKVKSQQSTYSIAYDETDTASVKGKAIEIPKQITVALPLFYRGDVVDLTFWFRYKLESGSIRFRLEPYRLREVVDSAFDLMVRSITTGLGASIPVLRGVSPA